MRETLRSKKTDKKPRFHGWHGHRLWRRQQGNEVLGAGFDGTWGDDFAPSLSSGTNGSVTGLLMVNTNGAEDFYFSDSEVSSEAESSSILEESWNQVLYAESSSERMYEKCLSKHVDSIMAELKQNASTPRAAECLGYLSQIVDRADLDASSEYHVRAFEEVCKKVVVVTRIELLAHEAETVLEDYVLRLLLYFNAQINVFAMLSYDAILAIVDMCGDTQHVLSILIDARVLNVHYVMPTQNAFRQMRFHYLMAMVSNLIFGCLPSQFADTFAVLFDEIALSLSIEPSHSLTKHYKDQVSTFTKHSFSGYFETSLSPRHTVPRDIARQNWSGAVSLLGKV